MLRSYKYFAEPDIPALRSIRRNGLEASCRAAATTVERRWPAGRRARPLDEAAPRQWRSRLAFGADLNVVYLAVGNSV